MTWPKDTYLPTYQPGRNRTDNRQEPPDNCQEPRTFTFDKQRATLETCDFWDIWSERGKMNWPTIWNFLTMFEKTYLPTYIPTYLITSIREHP